MPSVLLGIGFEQPGADRLRERGIVDADGEIGSGFVAGAVPSRADFDSVAEDAVVRRVLGLRADGRQDGDFGVERERADAAEKALLGQPSTVLLKQSIGICFVICWRTLRVSFSAIAAPQLERRADVWPLQRDQMRA